MSKENVSIRIFGRDMTFSVSPKEKNDLIKSAEILNNELDNISDKSNALVIAGLNLANKSLNQKESSSNKNSDINLSKLIEKIDKALEK
ncbi:MAG: cell division protein ZapA [Pseudomonadota bacterium]|jgi:cell division protein ZapA (FtsZ GTPase activity inhibitor)|nr:cell division protein ZapA [Pseudomonadota bacterium]|tara:strand:+ start:10639 stop:10905 length:267 start_codon:yes stop_codon:yes gene_type:complete